MGKVVSLPLHALGLHDFGGKQKFSTITVEIRLRCMFLNQDPVHSVDFKAI